MAVPTINSVSLVTDSEWTLWGGPAPRFMLTGVPGVDGAFVSLFGQGPRYIQGGGYLRATAASGTLASKALKVAIRDIQLYLSSGLYTFVDEDAESYTNCLLLSYEAAGRVQMQNDDAGTFTAFFPVRYTILELEPTG